jgi:hypothetical protein
MLCKQPPAYLVLSKARVAHFKNNLLLLPLTFL